MARNLIRSGTHETVAMANIVSTEDVAAAITKTAAFVQKKEA